MKDINPPRVYTGDILPFFGEIRRSTLLRLPRGVGTHSEALVSTVVSTPRGKRNGGGGRIRTAASRPKAQSYQVIQTGKPHVK